MLPAIPSGWTSVLSGETTKPYYQQLQAFLEQERQKHAIFPPEADVFAALTLTPLSRVRVVILGQDPYPGEGMAHGLSFSVRPAVTPLPKSLVNIFKELQTDIHCAKPKNGSLVPWARQGVLLLNAVLTVQAHKANAHKGRGWETFTDAIIRAVDAKSSRVVFLLWGREAQRKETLITNRPLHTILEAGHPSPLGVRGFSGTKPFSSANAALRERSLPEIDWTLPA